MFPDVKWRETLQLFRGQNPNNENNNFDDITGGYAYTAHVNSPDVNRCRLLSSRPNIVEIYDRCSAWSWFFFPAHDNKRLIIIISLLYESVSVRGNNNTTRYTRVRHVIFFFPPHRLLVPAFNIYFCYYYFNFFSPCLSLYHSLSHSSAPQIYFITP